MFFSFAAWAKSRITAGGTSSGDSLNKRGIGDVGVDVDGEQKKKKCKMMKKKNKVVLVWCEELHQTLELQQIEIGADTVPSMFLHEYCFIHHQHVRRLSDMIQLHSSIVEVDTCIYI